MAEWLGRALQKLVQQFESVWYLPIPSASADGNFYTMLTTEEEKFMAYWSKQRLRKKQFMRKFSIGLPLAVLIVAGAVHQLPFGLVSKSGYGTSRRQFRDYRSACWPQSASWYS
jgi:hypothetical protein